MKKKLLLLLIMFIPFFINALEVEKEWQKSFGGTGSEYVSSAIPSEDGGFFLVGSSKSSTLDTLINNVSRDAILIKYDNNGNIIWKTNWGGNDDDSFFHAIEFEDKSIILVGNSESTNINGITNKGHTDAIIVKYDSEGNMLWQKNWGDTLTDSFYYSTKVNNDNFIAVGSKKTSDVTFKAIIIKYDKDGTILWEKEWGGSQVDVFYSVAQTKDNGFIVVGDSKSNGTDTSPNVDKAKGIIIKYDSEGNLIWEREWGGLLEEHLCSVVVTENNEFLIIGDSKSTDIPNITNAGNKDGIILKYDNNGNLLFEKSWGGNLDEYFPTVALAEKENFIVTGCTNSTNIEGLTNKGDCDAIILKYDKNGKLLWKQNWSEEGYETFKKVLIHPTKSSIYAIGYSTLTNMNDLTSKGEDDFLIVKYNIDYTIEKKPTENGSIEAFQEDRSGVIIPKSQKDYKVDKIIVKDTQGNEIETTLGENGIYTFELYDDVTVEVLFALAVDNPKTGILNYGFIVVLFMIIPILGMLYISRYNQKYGL